VLYAFVFLTVVKVAADVEDDERMGRATFGQSGQLFSIKFIPGDRRLQVQLVGGNVATLDPDRIILLGRVYPRNGPPYDLNFMWTGTHFLILNNIDAEDRLEIKVLDRPTKKTEVFQLKRNRSGQME
jgi:hypothetical protein